MAPQRHAIPLIIKRSLLPFCHPEEPPPSVILRSLPPSVILRSLPPSVILRSNSDEGSPFLAIQMKFCGWGRGSFASLRMTGLGRPPSEFLIPNLSLFFSLQSELYRPFEVFQIFHIPAHRFADVVGELCDGSAVDVLQFYYYIERFLTRIV